jgi:hypothetical protein
MILKESSDITVPEMVTADSDTARVVLPPTIISVGFADTNCPPISVVKAAPADTMFESPVLSIDACAEVVYGRGKD